MLRPSFLALMFLVLAAPVMAATTESELTGKTLIDADVVTVGDLFTNAGGNANHVLAPAPEIGHKLVLNKNDLDRVVSAFKLNWKGESDKDIALERDASLVQLDAVILALAQSDLKDKISSDASFKLSNLSDAIIIPSQAVPELRVTNSAFDDSTEKFTANLQIMRDGAVIREVPLEGLATLLVQVPVLKYSMNSSTDISAQDIMEVSFPKRQLRSDIILSKDELIGMTVKRSLQAKQGVSHADIMPPLMVKRNEMVTVTYKNGPVVLSTKARSLGNGARGDTMTFMNTTSKKSFEAKVTGPQQAEVNLDV